MEQKDQREQAVIRAVKKAYRRAPDESAVEHHLAGLLERIQTRGAWEVEEFANECDLSVLEDWTNALKATRVPVGHPSDAKEALEWRNAVLFLEDCVEFKTARV